MYLCCVASLRRITSNIQHFTPSTGQWITRGTTGAPPLGVRAYCCTAINDQLYYFGGLDDIPLNIHTHCQLLTHKYTFIQYSMYTLQY